MLQCYTIQHILYMLLNETVESQIHKLLDTAKVFMRNSLNPDTLGSWVISCTIDHSPCSPAARCISVHWGILKVQGSTCKWCPLTPAPDCFHNHSALIRRLGLQRVCLSQSITESEPMLPDNIPDLKLTTAQFKVELLVLAWIIPSVCYSTTVLWKGICPVPL